MSEVNCRIGIRGGSSGFQSIKEFIPSINVFINEDDIGNEGIRPSVVSGPRFQGYNRGPIPYTEENLDILRSAVKEVRRPYHRVRFSSSNPNELRVLAELKKYLISVEAYLKRLERDTGLGAECLRERFTPSYFIENLFDRNFSKYLKILRRKSINFSLSLEEREIDPDEEHIKPIFLDTVDMIFNYRFCFFWEEEDPDDLMAAMIPLEEIPESRKEMFRSAVRSILPDIELINRVEPLEIYMKSSTSSSLDGSGKSRPVWVNKNLEDLKLAKRLPVGKRAVIPVYPQGYRDSVIFPINGLHSIQLIEEFSSQICEHLPDSLYFRNEKKIEKKIGQFSRNHKFFYNRDLKKEGLTKPRYLLRIILEEMSTKYGSIQPELKDLVGFYDDFWIFLSEEDKKPKYTERGHGLGMANALTTIVQQVIFTICKKRLELRGNMESNINALFYNDDCTIGFGAEDDYISYIELEDQILERFGLILNKKKSSYGENFIICERYKRSFNKKLASYYRDLYLPFLGINTFHAKEILSSITPDLSSDEYGKMIPEFIDFFGLEFGLIEVCQPKSFGGFFDKTERGVRTDLIGMEYSREIAALYSASKVRVATSYKSRLKKEEKSIVYQTAMERIYQITEDAPGINLIFPNFGKKLRSVERSMKQYKHPNEVIEYYSAMHDERRRVYLRTLKRPEYHSLLSIYLDMVQRFQAEDVFPPFWTKEANLLDKESEGVTPNRDSYRQVNSLCGALKHLIPRIKEEANLSGIEDVRFLAQTNKLAFRQQEDQLYLRRPFMVTNLEEFYTTSDYSAFCEFIIPELKSFHYYTNPFSVLEVAYKYYNRPFVPLEEKKPNLKLNFDQKKFDLNSILFYFSKDLKEFRFLEKALYENDKYKEIFIAIDYINNEIKTKGQFFDLDLFLDELAETPESLESEVSDNESQTSYSEEPREEVDQIINTAVNSIQALNQAELRIPGGDRTTENALRRDTNTMFDLNHIDLDREEQFEDTEEEEEDFFASEIQYMDSDQESIDLLDDYRFEEEDHG